MRKSLFIYERHHLGRLSPPIRRVSSDNVRTKHVLDESRVDDQKATVASWTPHQTQEFLIGGFKDSQSSPSYEMPMRRSKVDVSDIPPRRTGAQNAKELF